MTEDTRCKILEKGYRELAQAYHRLSGLIQEDKHKPTKWEDCYDAPCNSFSVFLTLVHESELVVPGKES